MGEARRKKLALLRQKFLPPPPEPEFYVKEDYRTMARDQLSEWFRKRYDDMIFEEMLK